MHGGHRSLVEPRRQFGHGFEAVSVGVVKGVSAARAVVGRINEPLPLAAVPVGCAELVARKARREPGANGLLLGVEVMGHRCRRVIECGHQVLADVAYLRVLFIKAQEDVLDVMRIQLFESVLDDLGGRHAQQFAADRLPSLLPKLHGVLVHALGGRRNRLGTRKKIASGIVDARHFSACNRMYGRVICEFPFKRSACTLNHGAAYGAHIGHKRLFSQERLTLSHHLFDCKNRHGNHHAVRALHACLKRRARFVGNPHLQGLARALRRQIECRHRVDDALLLHGPGGRGTDQTGADQCQTHCADSFLCSLAAFNSAKALP